MSNIFSRNIFANSEDTVMQEFAALSEGLDAAANSGTAYSMNVGDTFSGSISAAGDNDWISIALAQSSNTRISLSKSVSSSSLDTFLEIYDSTGALVASNDDGGSGYNSMLEFIAQTAGTYYINARAYNNASSGAYQVTTTNINGTLPVYTHDQIATYLTHGYWGDSGRSQRSFTVGADGSLDVDITSLNAAGQSLATWALEAWTSVTGIAFNFVDETTPGVTAEIFFDDIGAGLNAESTSTTSGTRIVRSEVTITTGWLTNAGHGGTGIDSYSFQTYMHEIGHALGLGHAGNYNGNATYVTTGGAAGSNQYLNDSWQATVMSYMSQTDNTYINANYAYVVTPMTADILAIQSLYGVGGSIRTGDTTYGEHSTAGGYLNSLTSLTNAVAFTVLDNGGTDTFDFGSATQDQRIDMRAETVSDIYDGTGNLSIARGSVIENVISGSGNDVITGNAADNVITGGGGADTIDGGDGDDTAVFAGNRSTYTITTTGAETTVAIGGVTSTLTNVEFLQFSDQTVTIGGANAAPTATLGDLTLAAKTWQQIGNDVVYTDSEGDTATHYQVWDSEGGNSFWVQYTGYVDASSGYMITADQLSGLWLRSDAVDSSQNLWVRAYDGNSWGAWDSFTLTTEVPNTAPTATIEDLTMAPDTWNNIGASVTYVDTEGDAATQYEIWDHHGTANSNGDANSFWVQYTGYVDATAGYVISAAQLDGLWLRSDSAAGSQNLWIRANDGNGWGEWDIFTLTTGDGMQPLADSSDALIF